jgi:hypothetical protein
MARRLDDDTTIRRGDEATRQRDDKRAAPQEATQQPAGATRE